MQRILIIIKERNSHVRIIWDQFKDGNNTFKHILKRNQICMPFKMQANNLLFNLKLITEVKR